MKKDLFEKFCRAKGMVPLQQHVTRRGTILLAEGFYRDNPAEYPFGYYRTIAALERNDIDVIDACEFAADHDHDLPLRTKQGARINAVLRLNAMTISDNVETGRYG